MWWKKLILWTKCPEKKKHPQLTTHIWLVVSTPLKNMSQLGWLFPIYGKIKNGNQTTNQIFKETVFWTTVLKTKRPNSQTLNPPSGASLKKSVQVRPKTAIAPRITMEAAIFKPWVSAIPGSLVSATALIMGYNGFLQMTTMINIYINITKSSINMVHVP